MEFVINRYTLLYINKEQGPMYSTGTYIQYFILTYSGKESEKKKAESLCYTPEIL